MHEKGFILFLFETGNKWRFPGDNLRSSALDFFQALKPSFKNYDVKTKFY